MKWTSRILILAIFVAAMVGCQKGQKAAASKEERSSAKVATAVPKSAGKSRTASISKSGGSKSGSSKSGGSKSGGSKSHTTAAKSGSTNEKSAPSHTDHPGTLTMADNGRSFDVRRGETIVLKLDASHASGFQWSLTDGIGAVLQQEGRPTFVASTTKSGKDGTETWRFRAVGAGRETVKIEYKRPWESIPEREFRFNVTVR